ncbi:MAG: mechanosensitive ion channel family protein [Deltaproteobacteria bacterium]|nr:mechanosensitive ion channel family protein [Deltaproteobacteria bacterium]
MAASPSYRQCSRGYPNVREAIPTAMPSGRTRAFSRFALRVVLEMVCVFGYMLTTFLIVVLAYDQTAPAYLVAFSFVVGSYYVRLIMFAAELIFAPTGAGVRLCPLEDSDARFLYRWIVGISIISAIIAVAGSILREVGVSEELYLFTYSISGVAVIILLICMILQSRQRVARAICHEVVDECTPATFRGKFARSWHLFAILYVLAAGAFWQMRVLLEGEGRVLNLIVSLFLIPLFIGIDQWGKKLLSIASGEQAEIINLSGEETSPEAAGSDTEEQEGEEAEKPQQPEEKIHYYLPLIQRAFRITLLVCIFFVLLKLWGIDLNVGRILSTHALSIVVTLLLAFIVWEYAKIRIDQKIQEEMPEHDEDMDEGGVGGTRKGTLLVLLKKFILAVLLVVVIMIVLSSIGVNIGPLIASAGVVGLAIGFGAQTLVRDIISGIFFLIDDAFRVGDYIEAGQVRGTVEHISLRSLRLRHHRGMIHTIPFGAMSSVTNYSRDYIIMKLSFRVRYDTDVDKVRKIIKKINKEISKDPELGPSLLDKIKSQGVREMDDSAMVMRVKFKSVPGEQFVLRREVYRRLQEAFRKEGIEFAHKNVTVYFPPESTQAASQQKTDSTNNAAAVTDEDKAKAAAAAAALAATEKKEPAGK